ncbi:28S ribosomal protein S29, mitochondrial [Frankliniella fusca]|uniref:Small ribosomal subunit protein mS29 n=1 Tax=Frankliniella fusca TaxID=407009 RepID=A0AAE1HKZ0_9NEOP|nr:28S ribosomal protein S29, mitochondrial [Frankliniella fusca]
MALRILHSEFLSHHVGLMQHLLTTERLLSSIAARPTASILLDENTSSARESKPSKVVTPFRTSESDPQNHSNSQLGRFYTVPEDIKQTIFKYGGLPRKFDDLTHVFTETSIMVRKPFLEIKDYVQRIDFNRPTVRIVLYGETGLGKSMTLAHVVHYGFNAGFLLVHVPWVNSFIRRCKDISQSESKPGMVDVPINAAAWLVHFRTQNQHILEKGDFKTTKSYKYGPSDTIDAGAPIEQLIEFGVGRAKYACDVVEDLLREVKSASSSGLFRTMVVIDGFNGLFSPFVKTERMKIKVINQKCTLALPFLEISRFDWCNGVVVASVDRNAHTDPFNAESFLPLYLLGKEGLEHLDPFIPINVERYNTAELNSAIDYYIDRHWIQHPAAKSEQGRAELRIMSGGNAHELMKICAPL